MDDVYNGVNGIQLSKEAAGRTASAPTTGSRPRGPGRLGPTDRTAPCWQCDCAEVLNLTNAPQISHRALHLRSKPAP